MTQTVPAWLDELRLEPGPPYQAMGTRALDLDAWLVADELRDEQLRRKRELIAHARDVVVATTPRADAASAEVLELVGGDPSAAGDHPLVEAALQVQEDLVVVESVDDDWIVTAGVVCFPTHWTIADKVGLPIAEVHAPVAHYDRELREKVDRFFDRLTADRPVWRRNWFVHATPELHLPGPSRTRVPDEIAPDGSPMWIRSERQTLRRLPRSGAVLFTIRIQLAPLGVLRARPDVAGRMLRTIRSWDEVKRAYTSTGRTLVVLDRWLASVADVH